MKIDSAIKEFSEKYNRVMLESIEDVSKKRELVLTKAKMKLTNIKESCEMFNNYLKGYAGYQVENKENPNISSMETITETVNNFISDQLFKEKEYLYSDIPAFVSSYVEGVKMILETIDGVKTLLTDNEVNTESVAAVNDFADMFIDHLNESFDKGMDQILWASGYNSRQKLFGKHEKEEKPVFV